MHKRKRLPYGGGVMSDLGLVETGEILDELEKRFDQMVFYANRENIGSIGKDKKEGTYRYAGDTDTILGLCVRIKSIILRKHPDEFIDED